MKKLPFAALLLLFCLPTTAGRVVTDTVKSKILSADVPYNVYLPDGFGNSQNVLLLVPLLSPGAEEYILLS